MARRLNDWLDSYVDYCCRVSEPPESFHRWCGISLIAAALQRKCHVPWGPLTFYPNMYIVIVSPSGRARKGTAVGFYTSFAEDLNLPLAAEAITREALIQALNKTRRSDPLPSGEMDTHSSLTIISPELTVFLGYNNHQLMSDLTDWYDCRNKWVYRTKTSTSDEIWGVWVNLFGATTPELIRTTLPLDAIGGGLTSRIIFVYEENKGRICPAPFMTEDDNETRKNLLHDLEQIHIMRGQFRATPEFLAKWIEWYSTEAQQYPFIDPKFGGYSERRPNHLMKLSMIISAGRRDSREMHGDDFDTAKRYLLEVEKKMPNVFAGMGRLENADVMQAVLAEIKKYDVVDYQTIMAKFYRDADDPRMQLIIQTLEASGFVKIIRDSRGSMRIKSLC